MAKWNEWRKEKPINKSITGKKCYACGAPAFKYMGVNPSGSPSWLCKGCYTPPVATLKIRF